MKSVLNLSKHLINNAIMQQGRIVLIFDCVVLRNKNSVGTV